MVQEPEDQNFYSIIRSHDKPHPTLPALLSKAVQED
jgi:hypothetical protein